MQIFGWFRVLFWAFMLSFGGKITESCGPLGFQPSGSFDGNTNQNVPPPPPPGIPPPPPPIGGQPSQIGNPPQIGNVGSDLDCRDLSLFQRSNRGGIEQYRFFYSQTQPGNRHPALSTVSVNCLENNEVAKVFAYKSDAPGRQASLASLITSGPTITATCTVGFSGPEWTVLGQRFDEVYCGKREPDDQFG